MRTTTATLLATATTTAALSLALIRVLAPVRNPGPEPGHACCDLLFEAVRGRPVVDAPGGRRWPVVLLDPPAWVAVRILIANPVAELAGPVVVGAPQVGRHLAADPLLDVFERGPDGL